MAVTLFLASGARRVIKEADHAYMDGPFFIVTRWYPDVQESHTMLSLRSQDVVRAEIQNDDGTIEHVLGAGLPRQREESS